MQEIQNYNELQEFLTDYNPGHDDTQIEYFIVGNGITDYGKYKQALAEMHTNLMGLQNSYIEQKKLVAKCEILQAEIDELEDTPVGRAKKHLKQIQVEEKQIALTNLERTIARNTHELAKMYELAKKYKNEIEGKDKKQLEKEFHTERLKKLFVMNTVWRGGNLSGVMDVVSTLPEKQQNDVLNEFRSAGLIQ
jgi:thioredoxin-like negative regulator of GroEL